MGVSLGGGVARRIIGSSWLRSPCYPSRAYSNPLPIRYMNNNITRDIINNIILPFLLFFSYYNITHKHHKVKRQCVTHATKLFTISLARNMQRRQRQRRQTIVFKIFDLSEKIKSEQRRQRQRRQTIVFKIFGLS